MTVLAKIAGMREPDRAVGKRLPATIKAIAPALSPRPWYGTIAYSKDGKVVCFIRGAHKFKTRDATFGFNDAANLPEGDRPQGTFGLKELTAIPKRQGSARS